jgi:hypothetical protein
MHRTTNRTMVHWYQEPFWYRSSGINEIRTQVLAYSITMVRDCVKSSASRDVVSSAAAPVVAAAGSGTVRHTVVRQHVDVDAVVHVLGPEHRVGVVEPDGQYSRAEAGQCRAHGALLGRELRLVCEDRPRQATSCYALETAWSDTVLCMLLSTDLVEKIGHLAACLLGSGRM